MYSEELQAMSRAQLASKIIEMGHVIRSLDEDNTHVELWSNDDDNAPMAPDLKAYEQTDIWIEQVDAAHKAFHERTENVLLAIEFLIHDLERIKVGEVVFINQVI